MPASAKPPHRAPQAWEFVPQDYFARLPHDAIFPAGGPLEVDLGCGDGSFLLAMATEFPERRFLGVERLLGRARKVCRRAARANLLNIKVLRLESRYTVEWLLAPESVSRLHLLCPDPWPKVRHHRRRLVQQEFLDAVERVLVPGGEFLFKTDHAEYFQWVAAEVASHGALTELPWEEDDFFYPKTDFQQHWEGQGKPIYQARYRRPGETAGN